MAITVSLTRKALEHEGACYDGLELFDQIKTSQDEQRAALGLPARRGLVIRWTPLHALWAATAYPTFCEWLTDRGLIPRADLYGADLYEADLAGAYLDRANLAGAYLDRANLARADLSGADLSGADLSGANLAGACLDGACLDGADLTWANLAGADLARANLARANLYGADLSRADLSGADLSGADLSRADLSGADLSGARRRRTDPALDGWEAVGASLACCAYLLRR